jgi:ribonuclease-3
LLSPLDPLAERLGLNQSSALLHVALTHSSYASEHDVESNERLEFLGDAVVNLAVADLIVTSYPQLNEGSGSLVRSRVVNESALATAAQRLDLARYLRIGRGVMKENGLERPSLLADAFEAVIAALYLDSGYEAAKVFVQEMLGDDVADAALRPGEIDPKTRLRQWAESAGRGTPLYDVTSHGPGHDVTFMVSVAGEQLATGSGRSKKAAEADAAQVAVEGRTNA